MSEPRKDFDELRIEQKSLINKMNLKGVKEYRERMKKKVENIHMLMREDDITDGRKKYLKGLRMVSTNLLAHTKERIATFNRIIHNGSQADFAKTFMDVACSELDLPTFQNIYGIAASKCEIKAHKIEDVAQFIEDSKKEKVNGNILIKGGVIIDPPNNGKLGDLFIKEGILSTS